MTEIGETGARNETNIAGANHRHAHCRFLFAVEDAPPPAETPPVNSEYAAGPQSRAKRFGVYGRLRLEVAASVEKVVVNGSNRVSAAMLWAIGLRC